MATDRTQPLGSAQPEEPGQKAPASRAFPRAYPLLFLVLLVLAALLRFYHLDASSLWSDEGNSWAMLGRSFGDIAAAAAADIHPPGYYWLLKLWSLLFGASATAMRALSALLGVLMVIVVTRIGRHIAPNPATQMWLPLLAGLLAAANPFLVYYSQEARMYILLALEAAILFWSLLTMCGLGRRHNVAQAVFVAAGIAGLWTHYSFPILLAAAGTAYLGRWLAAFRGSESQPLPTLRRFVLLNAAILLGFLPWLPTAVDRVLHWPKGGVTLGLVGGLEVTLRTLLFGPLRQPPAPLWPWLLVAGLLPVIGLWALRRRWAALALGLWLLAPIALMTALGLYSDAFLKFLLSAVPAWSLLVAAAPLILPANLPVRASGVVVVACFGGILAWSALPAYYGDPTARDNYRGIAAYLAARGDPVTDLVVLDAPGQQEVWRYYDPNLPFVALPDQRPAAAAATQAALAAATAGKQRVYALFWATDEADPEQLVETWLNLNGYKALDTWQGNLRFAEYRLPAGDLSCADLDVPRLAGSVGLVALCQPQPVQQVAAGDVALVRLLWMAGAPLDRRYKVTLQLLDSRGQVVAQHDGEPGGGSQPTDSWQPGVTVADNHGLFVPPGTPPGRYRLVAAVYDPESGQRLHHDQGDLLELGTLAVTRPSTLLPLDLIPMAQRPAARLGPVTLVGYDLHKKGYAHAPDTPLAPGDQVHVTLYWQAPDPLPDNWPADLHFFLRLGSEELAAPLAGGAYPTGTWAEGELVRAEFDLPFGGTATRPVLQVDNDMLELAPIPR